MTGFWIFLSVVVVLLVIYAPVPHDDTDPPQGRSGMKLFIDHRTGCHYLGTPSGGITPRLDTNGSHICEGGRS